MYIHKTHVSKASFTLTQLSTQHLFLENSSKAVNSPIVLLLLCITTRQLSWKKIQWISNLFPAKIFCGEKDLDTLVSLGMMKNKMQVRNPKTFNDQIQGQFTRYSGLNIWRNYCIHIYTQAYTFSVLSRLCRKLFEYARTFWHPLSHNLTTFLKYWRFSITNASKARDLLWPIPSPTKFFL